MSGGRRKARARTGAWTREGIARGCARVTGWCSPTPALARLGESDLVSSGEGAFGVLSDSFAIDEGAVDGADGCDMGGGEMRASRRVCARGR